MVLRCGFIHGVVGRKLFLEKVMADLAGHEVNASCHSDRSRTVQKLLRAASVEHIARFLTSIQPRYVTCVLPRLLPHWMDYSFFVIVRDRHGASVLDTALQVASQHAGASEVYSSEVATSFILHFCGVRILHSSCGIGLIVLLAPPRSVV